MTEWSMTRSTALSGLIFCGSPPNSAMAWRMAARSTTAGTPVKSCISTRAGRKAISAPARRSFIQAPKLAMSSTVTVRPSSWRSRFSARMRSETGSRERSPAAASAASSA